MNEKTQQWHTKTLKTLQTAFKTQHMARLSIGVTEQISNFITQQNE